MGYLPAQFTVDDGSGDWHRPRRCRMGHSPRETHARQGIAGQPVGTTRRRGNNCLRGHRGRCRPKAKGRLHHSRKVQRGAPKGEYPRAFCRTCRPPHAAGGCGSICSAELMMMSGLRVRGCAVLYRHGDARYGDCQSAKSPGHKRRIRSCRPSVSLSKQPVTSVNATRVGLQEAMRRLDASRCKPVASEGSVERAPHRNENDENTTQGLVKKNGTQR